MMLGGGSSMKHDLLEAATAVVKSADTDDKAVALLAGAVFNWDLSNPDQVIEVNAGELQAALFAMAEGRKRHEGEKIYKGLTDK